MAATFVGQLRGGTNAVRFRSNHSTLMPYIPAAANRSPKSGWHSAQVFAYDYRLLTTGFERDQPQQIFERVREVKHPR